MTRPRPTDYRSPLPSRNGHLRGIGNQGQQPGLLDGSGDPSLMAGAVPRDAAGNDLSPLGDKLSQGINIFVIDGQIGIHAKTADLAADVKLLPFAARHYRHGLFLLGRGGRFFWGGSCRWGGDFHRGRGFRRDRRRGRLGPVSYTHLRAHETVLDLVCRLLLEKKKKKKTTKKEGVKKKK